MRVSGRYFTLFEKYSIVFSKINIFSDEENTKRINIGLKSLYKCKK